MSNHHHALAYIFLLSLLLVALLAFSAVVFGDEAPAFPFASINQLDGLPGLKRVQPHRVLPCMGHDTAIARLADETGETVWQVFVQLDGPNITGAYYGHNPDPQWVYFGMHNQVNGHITIQRIEKFNPEIHFTPCSSWLETT